VMGMVLGIVTCLFLLYMGADCCLLQPAICFMHHLLLQSAL
jgi:hypothetical protein